MNTLDRLEEAENALQRASERKLEIPDFLVQRYEIAFLKGDQAGMEREAALGSRKSGAEDWISEPGGFCPGIFGSLATGKAEVAAMRWTWLGRRAERERAALFEPEPALWEAFFGNASAARQRREWLHLSFPKGRDVEYGAAFALALAGDSSRCSNTRE